MNVLTQRERAVELLRELFDAHPDGIERRQALARAREAGIGQRTMERAARDLNVRTALNGPLGAFWRPPK